MKLLPPGTYTVQVKRTRKVRNKPLRRIFYEIVEGPEAERVLKQTLREDDSYRPVGRTFKASRVR
jgi:hypothetical protein